MSKVAVGHRLSANKSNINELIVDVKAQMKGETPQMVLVYANNESDLKHSLDAFKKEFDAATVFGCMVPSKFSANDESIDGISCFALAGDYKVYAGMGTNLSTDISQSIDEAISSLPTQISEYPYVTGFIFYDVFSGIGEEIVMVISSILGSRVALVGGAAAGVDKENNYISSYVGLNSKVAKDSFLLVLLYSKQPLGIAVNHGHEAVERPVEVTKSDKNIVYELNNRPAWEVWKEISQEAAMKQGNNPYELTKEDEIANYVMTYEGSLASGEGKNKIRAILKVDLQDQSLHFACGIPEGVMMNASWTTNERTIDSACTAANLSRKKLQQKEIAGALVFDCVCRKLLLKDKFLKAIGGISQELGNVPLMGYETHGEICLGPGDLSGFHNTSTVVVSFPK